MISPISSVGLLCLSTYLSALVGSTAIPAKNVARQDGTCGGSAGLRCATDSDKCCSQWGWCGDTAQHCGTGCQPAFGSCTGGGGTTTPPTSSTTSAPTPSTTTTPPGGRSRPGSVPYGSVIESCTVPGVVALTFDDGPDIYTPQLITLLAKYNAKATFFVNGHNWGVDITDPSKQTMLKNMDAAGHQIGSHTWSHPSLSSLSAAQITTEMTQLEAAIKTAIGKSPTYMRPPYFECDNNCAPTMNTLAYHIIDANLDTLDWANTQNIQVSKDIFSQNVASGSLCLAHDVHQATVTSLAEFMITESQKRGLRLVTVGECLGDPAANWYRT